MKYKDIEINEAAMPLPHEEPNIKIFHRISTETGKFDGDPYGFMCKRCGAEWTFDGKRCHEVCCVFHR